MRTPVFCSRWRIWEFPLPPRPVAAPGRGAAPSRSQPLAVTRRQGPKVMFSQGELAPRMVASAAMPILYRPVEIDGDWYCDGALVDLAPMDAICCRHGLDALLIHHVATRQADVGRLLRDRWSMLGILERLLLRHRPWYLSEERLTFHRCPCRCGATVKC